MAKELCFQWNFTFKKFHEIQCIQLAWPMKKSTRKHSFPNDLVWKGSNAHCTVLKVISLSPCFSHEWVPFDESSLHMHILLMLDYLSVKNGQSFFSSCGNESLRYFQIFYVLFSTIVCNAKSMTEFNCTRNDEQ